MSKMPSNSSTNFTESRLLCKRMEGAPPSPQTERCGVLQEQQKAMQAFKNLDKTTREALIAETRGRTNAEICAAINHAAQVQAETKARVDDFFANTKKAEFMDMSELLDMKKAA